MNADRTAARIVALGALVAGVAVAAGAFGAHGLKGMVTPDRLAVFETGAKYAMYHGLALVAVGMLMRLWPEQASALARAAVLLGVGIAVFAGSLFALVLLDLPVLGAITPIGGVAMIVGWALVAWTMAKA